MRTLTPLCRLAWQSLIQGYTALFATAGQMLGELAALDSESALRRRLHRYASPEILVFDEVGYLSYSNRHADLLFEFVSRRYGADSVIPPGASHVVSSSTTTSKSSYE